MLIIRKRVLVWTLLALGLAPTGAFATTPTEQIEQTIRQVMHVIGDADSSEQRRQQMLREALMPRFDWLEMSKQALGKHWTRASGREREFVSVFAEFLGNAYIGQIGSYRNEKILFVQESIENHQAQVKTKIMSHQGEPISIAYHLHRVKAEWKIWDVVIEDVSIVANYRAQFNRVLARGNLDDLLERMREKEAKNHH